MAVEAGASITITRDGRPIAILAPVRRRTFVPISELAQTSTHLPRIDYAEWRADLDALIDPWISKREDPTHTGGSNSAPE